MGKDGQLVQLQHQGFHEQEVVQLAQLCRLQWWFQLHEQRFQLCRLQWRFQPHEQHFQQHVVLLLVVHGGEAGMAQASVVYVKDLTGTAYAAVEVRELEDLECDGEEILMLAQHDIPQ